MNDRAIAALRNEMEDADYFLVTDPDNIFYLTGLRNYAGLFVIAREETFFLASPFSRHTVDARVIYTTEEEKQEVVREHVSGMVVADDADVLEGEVEERDWIADLRATKTEAERKKLERAAEVTVKGMKKAEAVLRNEIAEQITPFDIVSAVEQVFRSHGCENAYDPLVQVNCIEPHRPLENRIIEESDVVIVDVGARYKGYCCDMSRTFSIDPSDRVQMLFADVKACEQACIEKAKAGMTCAALDQFARDFLTDRGYNITEHYLHALGHGVGINIHERPRISQESNDTFENNMVVAIEPGLYIPDIGGVRIEDTLIVQENENAIFTDWKREL